MSEAIQSASEQLRANIKLELSRFLQGSAEDLALYGEDITRDLEVAIARQDEKLLAELRAQVRALGAKRKIQASNAAWSLLDHLLAAAFHAAIAKLDELALIASSGEPPASNPASGRAMARVLLSIVAVILLGFAAWSCSSPGCVPAADTKPLLDIALALEEVALSDEYFIERKLYPNVDFYSGIIYKALNIPVEMFTVMFAIARTAGWIAHWLEQNQGGDVKIGRPRQIYVGPTARDYVPLSQRG